MTSHKKAEWYNWSKNKLSDGSYINSSGSVCYINDGEFHREDGPAVEYNGGGKEWWVNGKLHRDDGPAVEWANGDKEWWVGGKRHRVDGPAVEWVNDVKVWWLNDECFGTEVAYEEALKIWKMNEVMK